MISDEDYAQLPEHLRKLITSTSLYLYIESIDFSDKCIVMSFNDKTIIDYRAIEVLNQSKEFFQLHLYNRVILFLTDTTLFPRDIQ